jgi:integrase
MQIAMDLALDTGQRRGDLLALTRAQLTDKGIAFRQGKTGALYGAELPSGNLIDASLTRR